MKLEATFHLASARTVIHHNWCYSSSDCSPRISTAPDSIAVTAPAQGSFNFMCAQHPSKAVHH